MIRMKGDIIKQLNELYPEISFRIKYKNDIKERILFFVETKIDKEATFFEKMKQIAEHIVIENTEVKQIKKEFVNKYKQELLNSFNPLWLNKKRKKTIKEEIKEKILNIEEEDNKDYSLYLFNLFLNKMQNSKETIKIIEDFFKKDLKLNIIDGNNLKKTIETKTLFKLNLEEEIEYLKKNFNSYEINLKKDSIKKVNNLNNILNNFEKLLINKLNSEKYYIPIIIYKEGLFNSKKYIQLGKPNSLEKTNGKNIFREGKEKIFEIDIFERNLATNQLKEKLNEINEEKRKIKQIIEDIRTIKNIITENNELNVSLFCLELDKINTKYHW